MLPSPDYLKPDYGVNPPRLVRTCFWCGFAAFMLSCVLWQVGAALPATLHGVAVPLLFLTGMFCFLAGFALQYGSRRGKLWLREQLLAGLQLQGNEQILDVGCGSGFLLVEIAGKLTTGRAVGIDLWQSSSHSSNAITTAEENTRRANVAEQVELHIGDIRSLPFADGRFDVVVSNEAQYHMRLKDERQQVLKQMWRVLKSGGRIALIDSLHTSEQEAFLKQLGCTELIRKRTYFTLLFPSYLLLGTKP